MTDKPESEPQIVNSTPAALRDTRWLAGGIWGAVLLALLVSSWAAVSGGATGGAGLFFPYLGLGLENNGDANPELVASVALIITIALAGVLAFAWWRFATVTRQLLNGISDVSDHPNADPAPTFWLAGPNPARSELVDLFPALGVAWALLVIRPVAVIALQIYSTF